MTSPHTIFLTQYLIILDFIMKHEKKKSKKKTERWRRKNTIKKTHTIFFTILNVT